MKTNVKNLTKTDSLPTRCSNSCRKLLAQIEQAKDAIIAEFRDSFKAQQQLLHRALEEAQALACQTEFPLLVFPTLALEKAQAVVARQVAQHPERTATFAP
ncbi:MAG: hypothetical protein JWR69_2737 [Pedosphaera sp.]|nr:hypothetical protein [Pedosphaera sp.]